MTQSLDNKTLWIRYKHYLCKCPDAGLTLDISRMGFDAQAFEDMSDALAGALAAMGKIEAGHRANKDEKDDQGNQGRMVGHYWLRHSELIGNTPVLDDVNEHLSDSDKQQIKSDIEKMVGDVKRFASDVLSGKTRPPKADAYTDALIIGIGGSALGPQLLDDALGDSGSAPALKLHYLDNTDPDGFDRVLGRLADRLAATLVIVISKSGGTRETLNGMLETQAAFALQELDFAAQAVAVTGKDSNLYKEAWPVDDSKRWITTFPMWDWVGGRTSLWATVGLLPGALAGIDIDALLAGAAAMDQYTRSLKVKENPAAMLALLWHDVIGKRGKRNMVVLPYRDRLVLVPRYLQQLIMESLGKGEDRAGNKVAEGLSVFGNKGTTDQHSFVQQLREGANDFFVVFVTTLRDRVPGAEAARPQADLGEKEIRSGDFLSGFYQGTRQALYEAGRESITIQLDQLNAATLGALIALFERAVGLYAELKNINAYHQPGVQGGKVAAGAIIDLQKQVLEYLEHNPEVNDPQQITDAIGQSDQTEAVHHILTRIAANPS